MSRIANVYGTNDMAMEQSVIVTSQLLAASSCIDDITIGQHFESLGAVTG